jgi:probable F420-dependent oxidoreductase
MIDLAINLHSLHTWFDGKHGPILDLVIRAERAGVDQVTLGDHLLMGSDLSRYPYGSFAAPLDYPWMEPITLLAALSSVTERIRLSTGILISPLRPAALLAKQLATLDVLSGGRVDIGIGTGWQVAEYDACGISFAARGDLLDEQVRACLALWNHTPSSFVGRHVQMDNVVARPQPVQTAGIPILFGVPPSQRNFERIAELGQGWLPVGLTLEQFKTGMVALRTACIARGRDPAALRIRPILIPGKSTPIDEAFEDIRAEAPAWVRAGATTIEVFPSMVCAGADRFDHFLQRFIALKHGLSELKAAQAIR